ncbi:general substrate transporter [Aureobasidium pullulans]|nr:general substrate transporter [Aureobasidium pullulans]THX45126.1 general substrate transporter [Aureobasidium pullulans]THZ23135.1 general substrate transporter [Aureobasidium pullulans]
MSEKAMTKPKYFGMTGTWLTVWVTVACATDMTLFGYDQGVFGGVVVTQDYINQLNLVDNASLLSTITAIYDIGCFFGAIAAVMIGDPLGRKNSILLGTTIMSVGALLQCTAFGVPQMIVGRIVAGIGNGINTSTAPVWQGETSKASWRVSFIGSTLFYLADSLIVILNIFGFMLSNWVTFGFSYLDGGVSWRVPLAFQFIFIVILYATVPWLPESPRWLISKGRIEEANHILAALESTTHDDPYIITASNEIQYAVDYERENSPSWGELLRGKTGKEGGTCTMRRLFLGMGAQAMQQLGGINVTSYYLPTVLIQSVGLTEKLARLLAACNSVSYLLFSFISIPNVEKWGRRNMMIYASLGQGCCYLLITILLRFNEMDGYAHKNEVASASIAFFFLYYVFFGIGWQGVPWLYPTEINSLSMRTKGAALGTATNWIMNFMVVEITPIGINSIHWKFYIIWTVFNFSFIPVVYLWYPETADRTLEDMDRFFRENHDVFVFRHKDAISTKRPLAYIEREQDEVRRTSSVHAGMAMDAARNKSNATEFNEKREGTGRNATLSTDGSHDEFKEDV